MSKILDGAKNVAGKAKNVAFTGLKFGTAVSVGVIGTGVLAGVKAKHAMDKSIDSFADGLAMALIDDMSFSSFEKTINMHSHQNSKECKSRGNFDWAMASTFADDSMQYG